MDDPAAEPGHTVGALALSLSISGTFGTIKDEATVGFGLVASAAATTGAARSMMIASAALRIISANLHFRWSSLWRAASHFAQRTANVKKNRLSWDT
jgi:hypothetical protein